MAVARGLSGRLSGRVPSVASADSREQLPASGSSTIPQPPPALTTVAILRPHHHCPPWRSHSWPLAFPDALPDCRSPP